VSDLTTVVRLHLEFCYLGWRESLPLVAQLVEAEIPDGA
jgi:hypothetical protein